MLLRSITKHVKDQNWFAVALDFVIVVAGILIAFQITHWNEARNNRVQERAYLERLSSDLAATKERNSVQVERNAGLMKTTGITLSSLKSCALKPEDEASFVYGLYDLGRYNLPEFVDGTFEELNATGNFQLIRNLELRRNITRVYQDVERINRIDRQVNDRIIPKVNYVRRYISFNHAEFKGGPLELDRDAIEMDFEAICSDPVFFNSVSSITELMLAVDGLTKSTIIESEDLKAAIDEELDRLNK